MYNNRSGDKAKNLGGSAPGGRVTRRFDASDVDNVPKANPRPGDRVVMSAKPVNNGRPFNNAPAPVGNGISAAQSGRKNVVRKNCTITSSSSSNMMHQSAAERRIQQYNENNRRKPESGRGGKHSRSSVFTRGGKISCSSSKPSKASTVESYRGLDRGLGGRVSSRRGSRRAQRLSQSSSDSSESDSVSEAEEDSDDDWSVEEAVFAHTKTGARSRSDQRNGNQAPTSYRSRGGRTNYYGRNDPRSRVGNYSYIGVTAIDGDKVTVNMRTAWPIMIISLIAIALLCVLGGALHAGSVSRSKNVSGKAVVNGGANANRTGSGSGNSGNGKRPGTPSASAAAKK